MALDYTRLSRKQGRILSLETLAFYAVFRSVTRDLRRCPANCSPGSLKDKIRGSRSSDNVPSHLRDPDVVRDTIRLRLERTLAGVVSDQVRARLIECFNESNSDSIQTPILRPSVFLSSVLDHSFVKLKVKVTEPGFDPDLDVIPTIFEHSPLLQNLELDFFYCSAVTAAQQGFQAVLTSLNVLTELKELTISNIPDYVDMFGIGESCPKLEVLILGSTGRSYVYIDWGSIMGKNPRKLYPNFKVPDCMLKPICNTLKRLEFNGISLVNEIRDVAFILSNFPNLEILKTSNENVLSAIELLSDGDDATNRCQLKLKELPRVYLSDQRMLKVISEMLSSLESISFVDAGLKPLDAEILNMLATLTKVQRVSFEHVDAGDLANVIQLWSSQLTVLEVTGRIEIPLDILATCINLTEFSSHSHLRLEEPLTFDVKQPFLPKLVKVCVNSCLFDYGAEISVEQLLLLSKPSLKHVALTCCHLADTTEGWEKVFWQWCGLESLKIEKACGLDERLIRDLLRWMPKMKDVSLPESLKISREVQRQLGAQVNLKFYTFDLQKIAYLSQLSRRVRNSWDSENGSDDDNYDFIDDGRVYEPECRQSTFTLRPYRMAF